MEKKISLKENEVIEINGAKLTPSILEQLKDAQGSGGVNIETVKEYIADAVCYMLVSVDRYSGIDKETLKGNVINIATNLSYCREDLDYLNFKHP